MNLEQVFDDWSQAVRDEVDGWDLDDFAARLAARIAAEAEGGDKT